MKKTILTMAILSVMSTGVYAEQEATKIEAKPKIDMSFLKAQDMTQQTAKYADDGRLGKIEQIAMMADKYGVKALKEQGFEPLTIKLETWLDSSIPFIKDASKMKDILKVVNKDGTYAVSNGYGWIGEQVADFNAVSELKELVKNGRFQHKGQSVDLLENKKLKKGATQAINDVLKKYKNVKLKVSDSDFPTFFESALHPDIVLSRLSVIPDETKYKLLYHNNRGNYKSEDGTMILNEENNIAYKTKAIPKFSVLKTLYPNLQNYKLGSTSDLWSLSKVEFLKKWKKITGDDGRNGGSSVSSVYSE